MAKQKLVGINHVALEVGDVDEALEFYSKIFDFEIREREPGHVEIDLGDQFIALEDKSAKDPERHFGLVVSDKEATRQALEDNDIKITSERFLDFKDPWGNRIQVVQYDQVQFSKTDQVLKGMGVSGDKSDQAKKELKQKGLLLNT
jgi:lactoylglutathione lyase